jgi:hypothetical protein
VPTIAAAQKIKVGGNLWPLSEPHLLLETIYLYPHHLNKYDSNHLHGLAVNRSFP